MQYPTDYIIFDTETTGLDNKVEKIIEIGAIKVIDDKVVSTFEVLLDHNLPSDRYIPGINGIHPEEIKEKGIDPTKAFQAFADFIDHDITIMGHNILRFDIPFLYANFPNKVFEEMDMRAFDTAALYKARKLNVEPNEGQSLLDFMNKILGQRHYGVKYSIDTACIEFNIDKTKVTQHRALGDCYLTKEIFNNLCSPQKEMLTSNEKRTELPDLFGEI